MSTQLNWDQLLSKKREQKRSELSNNDYRSEYENDYDRIVFSSPFRRMQDKAQVFPLERNDFVRTRLTHSVEVAAIARSIGISVSEELQRRNIISRDLSDISVVLETAGLAHDLGNPPFGHFGEVAISNTFKEIFEKEDFEKRIQLTDQEKEDLCNFDGNCQMFRILTHLQCIRDENAFHLTYSTLATLMKYPFNSLDGNKKNNKKFCEDNGVFYKKFGYFSSEQDIAEKVLEQTGLLNNGCVYRHPLAFILEAADDIAYSAADLEDGFKKKLVTFTDISKYFSVKDSMNECTRKICEEIAGIIKDEQKYYSLEKKLQCIRIKLQGVMINKAVDAFVDNYDSIMNRNFKSELLMESDAGEVRKILKNMADDLILSNSEIEKVELGGEQVLVYLIKRIMNELGEINFIKHCISPDDDNCKISGSQKRIYDLISEDFRKVFELKVKQLKEVEDSDHIISRVYYYVCILVVDYISGMTDSYCVDLYRKLHGINLE